MTPDGVRRLVADGHDVVVERDAGAAVGFADAAYAAAGATLGDARRRHGTCDARRQGEGDCSRRSRRVCAPARRCSASRSSIATPRCSTRVLRAGVRVIGYETVRDAHGGLPMLAPMSRIAGRLAPFVGAQALAHRPRRRGRAAVRRRRRAGRQRRRHRRRQRRRRRRRASPRARVPRHGVLARRRAAARRSTQSLAPAGTPIGAFTLSSLGRRGFAAAIADADLVIGGVLEPGTLSPKLLTRAHLRAMRPAAALVDVGIDQGGIAETSRMTRAVRADVRRRGRRPLRGAEHAGAGGAHGDAGAGGGDAARTCGALAARGIAGALRGRCRARGRRHDLGRRRRPCRTRRATAACRSARAPWRVTAACRAPRASRRDRRLTVPRPTPCASSASPAGPAAARPR